MNYIQTYCSSCELFFFYWIFQWLWLSLWKWNKHLVCQGLWSFKLDVQVEIKNKAKSIKIVSVDVDNIKHKATKTIIIIFNWESWYFTSKLPGKNIIKMTQKFLFLKIKYYLHLNWNTFDQYYHWFLYWKYILMITNFLTLKYVIFTASATPLIINQYMIDFLFNQIKCNVQCSMSNNIITFFLS